MLRSIAIAAAFCLIAGCTTPGDGSGSPDALAGTWHLAELRSNDDSIGTVRPSDPSRYEMRLAADGSAALRLDCNRGTGRWESAGPKQISFTPLAMTRAMCRPGSLDTRVARELGYVRTYSLEGDRLILDLMADGGNQVWTRAGG